MKSLLTFAVALFSLTVFAQSGNKSVVIGSMIQKPNALLIVNPPNSDQGVLLPQLSTGQRMSLKPNSPEEDGLLVFDNNLKTYYYWNEGSWVAIGTAREKVTSYYSIDPASFQSLKPEDNIRHNNLILFENENTFVTLSRRDEGERIIAPVNLPHGVSISELSLFYMDNDNDDLKIYLTRKSHLGNSEVIISWESSGASPSVQTQTFNAFNGMDQVDLENYTYRIVVEFDLDNDDEVDRASQARQRIYGARIQYQQ